MTDKLLAAAAFSASLPRFFCAIKKKKRPQDCAQFCAASPEISAGKENP